MSIRLLPIRWIGSHTVVVNSHRSRAEEILARRAAIVCRYTVPLRADRIARPAGRQQAGLPRSVAGIEASRHARHEDRNESAPEGAATLEEGAMP
jgi:hypothetical protein